jgi:hypothetical protein
MHIFITQETAVWLVNSVFPKCPFKYTIPYEECLQISSESSHKCSYNVKMELKRNIWIKCMKYYNEYLVDVTRKKRWKHEFYSYYENNIHIAVQIFDILFENYSLLVPVGFLIPLTGPTQPNAHKRGKQRRSMNRRLNYFINMKGNSAARYIRRTRLQNCSSEFFTYR